MMFPGGPGGMNNLNGSQNGTRKRSFHEQAGGDGGNFQYGSNDTRNFKQPRRGGNLGRGGRPDAFEGNRGGRQFQSSPPVPQQTPGFPPLHNMQNPLPGMQLDQNDPMAAMKFLQQAMGFQIPGMPPPPFPIPSPTGLGTDYRSPSITRPQGQKLRCQDYDVKGFCARGNTCQFEHGSGSIYMPSVDGMFSMHNLV